ncbi:hypothetical protein ACIBI9_58645 [Nonomuraea sp. NPDC050451]|uniref:hypothetical protein n=1 Tax=Nonomuraea sp. NPDC050451 TaxID=3364364 RepID=UPI003787DB39
MPTDSNDKRCTVVAVKFRSNIASAAPSTRSIRVVFGGSIQSSRQRAAQPSRDISTGQILAASQSVSLSSSPTVGSRKSWNPAREPRFKLEELQHQAEAEPSRPGLVRQQRELLLIQRPAFDQVL